MPILSNAAQNLPSPPESLPDPHAIARDVTPANDAHAHDPLPTCALTDARRAELAAEAARVPAPKVKPLPAHLDERLRWLGGILATAWTDQADLAREVGLVGPRGGEDAAQPAQPLVEVGGQGLDLGRRDAGGFGGQLRAARVGQGTRRQRVVGVGVVGGRHVASDRVRIGEALGW